MEIEKEIQVDESSDGGAIVHLPEEDLPEQPAQQQAEAVDPPEDDSDIANDDPDREAIRAARREERRLKKQLHQQKNRESNHLISSLQKKNQALEERLAKVEKRTSGAELARVDKAIDDAGVSVEYAKMKIQEAVNAGDGASMTRAQELWYEAQRKLESLKSLREQATRQMSQPPNQGIQPPNVAVQRRASEWMAKNPWYDPRNGDFDSETAFRIDQRLTAEGFDPTSDEYWDEMDSRVKQYLPHRATSGEPAPRRDPPRSAVTSTGRDSSPSPRAGQMVISPERVAAMKEAGVWDNPEKRNKMIKSYAAYDRANKGK